MIKAKVIKFLAFFIRAITIIYGLILAVSATIIILISNSSRANPNETYLYWFMLITGVILIFPFRFIRSYGRLSLYFYLLLSTTIGLILFSTTIGLILFNGEGGIFLKHFVESIIFSLNLLIVYLFIQYKHNPNLINPLLEKRDYSVFILVFITLFIPLVYLFVDLRTSYFGLSIFRMPYSIPDVTLDLNPKSLKTGYTFYDTSWENGKQRKNQIAVIQIVTPSITKDDFIEIYENNKKIYRLVYSKRGIKTIAAYDSDGTEHKYVEEIRTFASEGTDGLMHDYPYFDNKIIGRDKNGRHVVLSHENEVFEREDLDFTIHYVFRSGNSFIIGAPGDEFDKLQITVTKSINYPKRPRNIPLPFFRSTQDWNIYVKSSTMEFPVVNKLHLWY